MLPSYLGWLLSCKKKKHTISTSSSLRCFKHLSCFTSIENQYFSCAVFSLAERKSICVVPWRVYCKDSDHVGYSAAGVLFWLVVDKTFQVSSDFLIWANICWNILNAWLLCDIKNCNAVRLISKTIYNVLFHSKTFCMWLELTTIWLSATMLDYLTHFTVERNHSESALILVVCRVHLVCTLRTVSFRLSKLTLIFRNKKRL